MVLIIICCGLPLIQTIQILMFQILGLVTKAGLKINILMYIHNILKYMPGHI